jgi:hypothetical protein
MRTHQKNWKKQAGISLLQVMLMIVLIGAITATGFQILQSRKSPGEALSREQALVIADNAVAAFAAANSRLPCPSPAPGGKEDCTKGKRGYLPVSTLVKYFDNTIHSKIGASGIGPLTGSMVYALGGDGSVKRETEAVSVNLAATENLFIPLSYNSEDSKYVVRHSYAKGSKDNSYDAVNGLDFCLALSHLSLLPTNTTHLNAKRKSHAVNIAYAVAIDGISDGDGDEIKSPSSIKNEIALASEIPAEGAYGDYLRVRTRESLAQAVGCPLFANTTLADARSEFADTLPIASLDLGSDAVDLDEQVKATQEATAGNAQQNREAAERAVAMSTIATVLAGADVAVAGLELAESISWMAKNVFLCAITFGLECWRLAPSGAAIGFNGGSLGTSIGALAGAGISLGLTSDALVQAQSVEATASAAAEPKEFNILEAIENARISAEGDDCTTHLGVETCKKPGLKQALAEAKNNAKNAKDAKDNFYQTRMQPWSDAQLPNRISGYSSLSAAGKVTELDRLRRQISSAQNLTNEIIKLDELEGRKKAYAEQIKTIDGIVSSSSDFGKLTSEVCASADSSDKARCSSNRQIIEFATTCQRNGELYTYDSSKPDNVPMCYAAVREAQNSINPLVEAQKRRRDSALAIANAEGATKNVSSTWVPAVYDTEGKLVTAGYYRSTQHYRFRYPSDWDFCKLGTTTFVDIDKKDGINDIEDKPISGCSRFSVYWNYWNQGDYLPLVRTNNNQKWLSYGDIYRTHQELTTQHTLAMNAETDAETAYANALQTYRELLAISTNPGSGNNVELWIGPHDILKAMDDRGAVGSDRKTPDDTEGKP